MRSVQTLRSVHAQRARISPAGIVRRRSCGTDTTSGVASPRPSITPLPSWRPWLHGHYCASSLLRRSDFRRPPSRVLCYRRISLLHSPNLPTIPSPTTPCSPRDQSVSPPKADRPPLITRCAGTRHLGLRHYPAGSSLQQAESSSLPTDWSFTSGCSPPPLAGTQLHSITAPRSSAGDDFHVTDLVRSQAHWVGLQSDRVRRSRTRHALLVWHVYRLAASLSALGSRCFAGHAQVHPCSSAPRPAAQGPAKQRERSTAARRPRCRVQKKRYHGNGTALTERLCCPTLA